MHTVVLGQETTPIVLSSGTIFYVASPNSIASERIYAELRVAYVVINSYIDYVYVHGVFGFVEEVLAHSLEIECLKYMACKD